ncbi:MAG: helix-turn-helix transcriptional regulator [Clostridia bacterium]|nr:helix-turn-helix transcriptional regulator [Clostridia bacterium]
MPARLENFTFGRDWTDVTTDYYEGYEPHMSDYHIHHYYELSLILSGNVKILLSDTAESGCGAKLLLLRPETPHFIVCQPDMLYRRRNLLFSADFLADHAQDLQEILPSFGKNGVILKLTDDMADRLLALIEGLEREESPLRKKPILLYFLSIAADIAKKSGVATPLPAHVSGALRYIAEHYAERIVAADLAWQLNVGRTTLMTAFKKYTGMTLNDYVTHTRIRHAAELLRRGKSEPEVAKECGFNDCCNMIRCFKKSLGIPPMRYLAERKA